MKLTQKHNNINRQIAGMITGVIVVTLALCLVANTCFLGDFYLYEKEKDLKYIYEQLEDKASSESLYLPGVTDEIAKMANDYSVSVMVVTPDGTTKFGFNGDTSVMLNQMMDALFDNSGVIIYETDAYSLKSISNETTGEEYVILIGYLSDGNIAFIRYAKNEIAKTVNSTNKFTIMVFVLAIMISFIITYLLVKYLTKSLLSLIEITKKIANFNFESKYKPQKIYNEIDDLGERINEMSSALERAINQLKKANESLKHDLEIQEETENMRKEFISNVSHELKTPIALIQGYAEGLQEGIMDDENSRQIYLDVILDEANKMNRLVREMLILNQLEAGQMAADLCDFNVTEVLDGIIDSNQIYFEGQGIDFTFVNKEPVMVHSDEFLVEQVFTNFMSNAIHYVLNENIITVKYEFSKKNKVRIIVFNSGNNIAKKDIKHIWEKFYKADKARSREYGGSGIGLSVVKATMDLLHEKFGVENVPNGVEFWFELTLAKDTNIKQNS